MSRICTYKLQINRGGEKNKYIKQINTKGLIFGKIFHLWYKLKRIYNIDQGNGEYFSESKIKLPKISKHIL